MRDFEPDYSQYETHELEDAAARINRVNFPERAKRLDDELAKRRPSSHQSASLSPSAHPAASYRAFSRLLIACLVAPWAFFLLCGAVLFAASHESASSIQAFVWIGALVLAIGCPVVITKHEPPESVGNLVLLWVGFPIYVALCGVGSMLIWLVVLLAMGHTPR